jgi:hypothetical protein
MPPLDGFFLGVGWDLFTEETKMAKDDILIFTCVGDVAMEVSIFSKSVCLE